MGVSARRGGFGGGAAGVLSGAGLLAFVALSLSACSGGVSGVDDSGAVATFREPNSTIVYFGKAKSDELSGAGAGVSALKAVSTRGVSSLEAGKCLVMIVASGSTTWGEWTSIPGTAQVCS